MITFMNKRLLYTILFYTLIIVLLTLTKPRFLYNNAGVIPFGVGLNKSIFSIGTIVFILSLISFYLFLFIDIIFKTVTKN